MATSNLNRTLSARLFDHRLSDEWMGFTILRRVIISVAVVHFSHAAASGYRAIFQVYSVNIEMPAKEIRDGSPVAARFVTSGRVPIAGRLELVQGSNSAVLGRITVPENKSFFYDPRPQRATIRVMVSLGVLSHFQAGPALLRAVGEGRSQFVRVPPPKIQILGIVLIK
jgi:hypothetical protein